jgi:hypothetical protein
MPDPKPTLRSFALAGVSAAAGAAAEASPEINFLRDHYQCAGAKHWVRDFKRYLRKPSSADAPLASLARTLALNPVEILSVALAAAVETDLLSGRALARVQSPLGGSRPTLGLAGTAFAPATRAPSAIETILTGAAMRSGLLTLLNEGAPVAERPIAIPLPTCLALDGHELAWPGATPGMGSVPPAQLPPSMRSEAARHAAALESNGARALVLRSASTCEGRSIACAIAETIGRRALFIESGAATAGIVPWLLLRDLLPVFCLELAPGERKSLPPLPFYNGPVLALCGPDGSVDFGGEPASNWSAGTPRREERLALWKTAIGQPQLAADLALHHRHGCGRIADLGRLARHRATLDGRSEVSHADLLSASWVGEGSGLDALAQALRDPVPDAALVTPPNVQRDLERLHMRCLARDGLADMLGISAATRYRPGVRALFTGPSGTGKTLAAGWLATRLRLPLYRVDLASITSKYIGETEKNLAQLMARAEQSEVVLLFDEADSLFGRRTEIREANDRFANAQTNYLLQRIETFDGIAVLTANSRGRFDNAFARRLDAVIEFPPPGPEQRRDIWQAHLGKHHALTPTDLNRLAVSADLNGGNIRNVVLAAAVLAQAADRGIAYPDLVEGIANEYRKLGRQMPVELLQT